MILDYISGYNLTLTTPGGSEADSASLYLVIYTFRIAELHESRKYKIFKMYIFGINTLYENRMVHFCTFGITELHETRKYQIFKMYIFGINTLYKNRMVHFLHSGLLNFRYPEYIFSGFLHSGILINPPCLTQITVSDPDLMTGPGACKEWWLFPLFALVRGRETKNE